MITWMQRHRKKMVAIMWITVIAFVGAGFVGWGSYKYGSKSSALAMVGDVAIKQSEFQNEYSRLYSYYNQIFNGKLPDDQAKQLQDIAMQRLITQAYLLNLSKKIGITASDDEVAAKIINMDEFKKNGKFDKNIYQKVLTNAHLKISQFEDDIRKSLILEKISKFYSFEPTKLEFDAIAASIFLADKLKIQIIDEKNIKLKMDEKMIKEYWQKNKQKYMGEPKYDLAYLKINANEIKVDQKQVKDYFEKNKIKFISLNSNKKFRDVKDEVERVLKFKKAKKEALKKKLALKKGKLQPKQAKGVRSFNLIVPREFMPKLSTTNYSKPIKTVSGYVIAKIIKKYQPKPLSFKEAKIYASRDLRAIKLSSILEKKAKEAMKQNSGKVIGFVTQNDANKIKDLNEEEALKFLNHVFSKKNKKGYINLGKKVVVYEILEQKLFDDKEIQKNKDFIATNTKNMKKTLFEADLIKQLKKIYEVKKFY